MAAQRKHAQTEKRKEKRKTYKVDPVRTLLFNRLTTVKINLEKYLKNEISPTRIKHTKEIINCSLEEFKQHIEKQLQEGMTWENYKTDWILTYKISTKEDTSYNNITVKWKLKPCN